MQPFTFFLSYRRIDSAPIALLLKYEIERRLQFVRVFVDVADIRGAESFPQRIKALIDASHATIALIGPRWMPPAVGDPSVSADDDGAWVAAEVEYSLNAPLKPKGEDAYGLVERAVLPLFVGMHPDFRRFRLPPAVRPIAERNARFIFHENWPTAIGPLIDDIAVSLTRELKKRPDADEYPLADQNKARTQPMSDKELRKILQFDDYEGWYIDNFGNSEVVYLAKTFKFSDFNQAAAFMELVSSHCKVMDHHPEWRNVFNHVTVSLTTWDAKRRVTIYDLNLALFMNKAAEAVRRRR